MNNLFKDIDVQLDLIKSLEYYEVELGILKENQFVTVAISHGNGNTETFNVPIEDIVYMNEYGTLSFPGIHILQYLLWWTDTQLTERLNKIIDYILERDWTENDIEIEMYNLESFINNFIKGYIAGQIKEMTFLADKTNQQGLTDFPIDISLLKNYIQCKIFKKV